MRVDAHQHFWRYDPGDYGWIDDSMAVLRRDFLSEDLSPHLRANELHGSVAVQARQSEAETHWLLELAGEHDTILGVVGWVDLCAEDVAQRIHALQHPKLCGMRHVLQDEPDDAFMLRNAFRRGLRALADAGTPYDLLVFPRHLAHVSTLLQEFRAMPFVIDHLAKPPIRAQRTDGWEDDMRRVAEHPNVYCKVSGLVTEASWDSWLADHFTAYLDVVFDAFGPERLMFGSDWPVCLLAASYDEVLKLIDDYICRLSPGTQAMILGENATRFYGLGDRA